MFVSASSPFQMSSNTRFRRSQSSNSTSSWRSSTVCASSPESMEEDMELDSFEESASSLWSHSQRSTGIDAFNLDLTQTNTSDTSGVNDKIGISLTTPNKLSKHLVPVKRSQSCVPIVIPHSSAVALQEEQSRVSNLESSHLKDSEDITNVNKSLLETSGGVKNENKRMNLKHRFFLFFILLTIVAALLVHIVGLLDQNGTPCVEQIDIPLLHRNMLDRVFGQHIAVETAIRALREFDEDRSQQLLVMLWHGWTGIGKNFMGYIMSMHLTEPAVHKLIFPLHFVHGTVEEASDLRNWILSNVTSDSSCPLQLFIIDEVDKAGSLVVESLYTTLVELSRLSASRGHGSRAVVILVSNDGAENINLQLSQLLASGVSRDDVKRENLQPVFHSTWLTKMVGDGLIDYVVPFLPLERRHVIQCVETELERRRLEPTPELIDEVMAHLSFFPSDFKFFVKTGCRRIGYLVDLVI